MSAAAAYLAQPAKEVPRPTSLPRRREAGAKGQTTRSPCDVSVRLARDCLVRWGQSCRAGCAPAAATTMPPRPDAHSADSSLPRADDGALSLDQKVDRLEAAVQQLASKAHALGRLADQLAALRANVAGIREGRLRG